jgi:chromosome segregation ATPase
MDSVYKLSKYSQKIDEACRAKQLDKVMEYNKHEIAYINKLSKYFGNQKGGATTVEQVVEAVKQVLNEAVANKDEEIKRINRIYDIELEKLKNELGTKNNTIQEISKEMFDNQEEFTAVNAQLAEVKAERDTVQTDREELQRELTELIKTLKSKDAEYNKLELKEKERVAQLQIQTSEKESVEKQLTTAQQAQGQLQERIRDLEKKIGEADQKYQILESEIKETLQKKNDRIQETERILSELENNIISDRKRNYNEKKALQAEINRITQEFETTQQALQETVRVLTAKVQEQQRQAPGAQGGSKRKK